MSEVINLADYKARKHDITDFEMNVEDFDTDKLMKLYNDIMKSSDSVEDTVNGASVEVTRNLISTLYEYGLDPHDENIANDMIFITMLFSAAVEEYLTGNYADGIGNEFYRHLVELKNGIEV